RFAALSGGSGGWTLCYLGPVARAKRARAAAPAGEEEARVAPPNRRFCLAWMLADRAALTDARATAEELAASGRARRLPLDEGRGRWVLAEVLCRQGALEEAEREAQAALEILGVGSVLDHPVRAAPPRPRGARGRPGRAPAARGGAFFKFGPPRSLCDVARGISPPRPRRVPRGDRRPPRCARRDQGGVRQDPSHRREDRRSGIPP